MNRRHPLFEATTCRRLCASAVEKKSCATLDHCCDLSRPSLRLAQQAQPTTVSTTPVTTIDEVLREIRGDLKGDRTDIMSKNMTLTSEQAAMFWPVFAEYQKEQNVIMDDQMRAMQTFLEKFDSLSDADALALIKGHLDRDPRMVALRQKWLPKFQEALGTKLAVRAMQIDRRLSFAHQIQFSSRLPLAH